MISKSFVAISAIVLGIVVSTCHADDTCPDTGVYYLPNYANCSRYYVCNEGNKTALECQDGYAWNVVINTCDREYNFDCRYLTTAAYITTPMHTTVQKWKVSADECPETGTSYLPDYLNCTKFYKCEEGVKTSMVCPDGFAWSEEDESCLLEEKVDCSYVTIAPTTPGNDCPATGVAYLPDYNNCSKFYQCEEGVKTSMTCPDGFAWSEEDESCLLEDKVDCNHVTIAPTTPADNDCPATGVAYLPDYNNCSKFYECKDGNKSSMSCPDGYAWDINGRCKLAETVDCRYVSTNPTTITNAYTSDPSCPSDGTSYLPHPYDCSKYYECIDGKKVLLPCVDGYLFSVDSNTCEPATGVDCSYTSPGGSTETTPASNTDTTTSGTGTTTSSGTGTTQTPPTAAPIDDLCVDQAEGALIPYPSDCTMFVECRSNEGILFQCQTGSSWNQNQQVCDTNNDDNCSGSVGSTTPSTFPGTATTSSGTITTKSSSAPDVTTKSTASTTRGYTSDPSCPADGTSYLPHPTDCSLYYECINGQKVLLPCADGYYFSSEIDGCDIAANVDCSHTGTYHTQTTKYPNTGTTSNPVVTTTGQTPTSSPLDELCTSKEDGTLLAHPTDCAKFVECEGEEAVLYQCETGSGWNDSTKGCDTSVSC